MNTETLTAQEWRELREAERTSERCVEACERFVAKRAFERGRNSLVRDETTGRMTSERKAA